MKLDELKGMALKLIDEFINRSELTDDNDIKVKLNDFFNNAQIEVSGVKKISKTLSFEISESPEKEYSIMKLPSNFRQEKRLRFFPSNNSYLRYYIQDKVLKIHKSCLGVFELEYYAFPELITQENEEDYESELDLESQMALPIYVASIILMGDVSANYTAFEAKYNAKLELLMKGIQEENTGTVTINQIFGDL